LLLDDIYLIEKNNSRINLDDLVPSDHLLRTLERLISFDWVRDKTRKYYSHTGKPSVDPTVLVKMLIIGYLYDIRSERRLVEDVSLNLAYRWYVGYDIDEKIPDHSIFTKARKRFGKELFIQIFEDVLKSCIKAGLVSAKEILIDSTIVRADASMNSIIEVNISPEEYWRKLDESEIPNSPRGRKPKGNLST
jgi:transposase